MTTNVKKILPYILTSLLVIGFWKLWTWTDNYAFSPQGKDLLMLDIALTSIFIYKTIFWLVIANLTVLTFQRLRVKNYKVAGIIFSLTVAFYFAAGHYVNKKCAFHYYSVFINQSTMEEQLTRPILEAGYQIGPIITENIADKEMKYRRYAIGGLEKIKYKPATPTLTKILLDKSEIDVFRADAFQALTTFNTDETRKIISTFRQQANDTLDKKVIEYADYWAKHK
jgi:hypothetical protein